jgi:hypothetical protein
MAQYSDDLDGKSFWKRAGRWQRDAYVDSWKEASQIERAPRTKAQRRAEDERRARNDAEWDRMFAAMRPAPEAARTTTTTTAAPADAAVVCCSSACRSDCDGGAACSGRAALRALCGLGDDPGPALAELAEVGEDD